MLKSLHELLEPNPRFAADMLVDSATGFSANDHWRSLGDRRAIRLLPTVPTDVQNQIDTERHAFIYAGFCYGLTTFGEQHAYGSLENGLRLRAAAASAIPKRRGLGALLEKACELGWLGVISTCRVHLTD
jgi:hypothetical protein